MKELPAGGREPQASLLHGLLTRLRLLAGRRNGDGHTLRETLEELIEEGEEEGQRTGEFTDQERALLLNALSFGELQVLDVMVPRADIKAIDVGVDIGAVVAAMREAMHTRLPVYRNTLDEVIGMVHIKDILPFWGDGAEFQLERIKREILFVPHSMRVLDLLLQMRDTGVHMAIVVDEYGGTDGMVTIEDMVEEIVGEIQDEHDKILPPRITDLADGVMEADARVEVEDLEKPARPVAARRRAARGCRHPERPDLHPAGPAAGTRRGRASSGGHRLRGDRRRSAPDQAPADPAACAERGAPDREI